MRACAVCVCVRCLCVCAVCMCVCVYVCVHVQATRMSVHIFIYMGTQVVGNDGVGRRCAQCCARRRAQRPRGVARAAAGRSCHAGGHLRCGMCAPEWARAAADGAARDRAAP